MKNKIPKDFVEGRNCMSCKWSYFIDNGSRLDCILGGADNCGAYTELYVDRNKNEEIPGDINGSLFVLQNEMIKIIKGEKHEK